MGARGRNFYNDLARRYGYEKEAAEIQDLYLSGKKDEAAALVPQEFLDLTSLIGPRSWVAERIAAMREAGVTHLQVTPIPTGDQTAAGLDRRGQRAGRVAAGRPARSGLRARAAVGDEYAAGMRPIALNAPRRVAFRPADGGLADRRKLLGHPGRHPLDRLRCRGGDGARDRAGRPAPGEGHRPDASARLTPVARPLDPLGFAFGPVVI